MSDAKWTPIAARARHSFGQRRTSGASYPTRLDLIQANQTANMSALARIAVQLGIDHPTDPIRAYSAILANHADCTLARLDAKLNQWPDAYRQQSLGDGAQIGEQLQGNGPN